LQLRDEAGVLRYEVGHTIDTFALGHYARVYEAYAPNQGQTVALKVMRAEHRNPEGAPRWEAEAFLNEADLLLRLADLPAVMRLYDCGYVESVESYPQTGAVLSCGLDLEAFRAQFHPCLAKGLCPYLSLEYLPRQHNLLYVMGQGAEGRRRRLPTEEGLDFALQFGQLLYRAHERDIVYLDHKLEHAYWDGRALRVIDWNSSKWVSGSEGEKNGQKINDLHNLCVGILYPIFTGASPQKGSLRPQPGSQSEVESRYENIRSLDFSLEPTLSAGLQAFLDRGAKKQLATATEYLAEVQRLAVRFGWSFVGQPPSADHATARDLTRQGLNKLRESAEAARQARELLLSAAALDAIHEDVEAELRRLLATIGEYLNARPIP
jgi:hypothetical protein